MHNHGTVTTLLLFSACLSLSFATGCPSDEPGGEDGSSAVDGGTTTEMGSSTGADEASSSGQELPPFGGQQDVEQAAELWTEIQGWDTWSLLPGEDGIRVGGPPHGDFVRVYANETALTDIAELPAGSVLLKENFADEAGEMLGAVTVMHRIEGYEPEAADWFWAKYLPDGTLDQNADGVPLAGRVGLGADMGCIACHANADGGDFVHLN